MELKDLEISKLGVKENEVIVLKVKYGSMTNEVMRDMHNGFKQMFPKNKVVIIPKDMEISTMRKEELIEYIENM